jgi:hypothetical protein
MFDQSDSEAGVAALTGLIETLREFDQDVEDRVRIDRIRALEELKSAAAAAQARETVALATAQSASQSTRGIAGQVGLARRISPYHAARYVGWAKILTRELPHTFAALAAGKTSEWRALLVARETVFLSREHRATVDAELAPKLESLGDRRTEAEAKKLAYRLDPHGFVDRVRGADKDRRVTLRPAPDAMGRLTILAPVAQAVAAHAALLKAADQGAAAGDPCGRGQLMIDTAIERLTGQASAADVPVEIHLLMTDQTLLDPDTRGGQEPAHLDGYGPIPAGLARSLALNDTAPVWLRRLFRHPTTGELAAMQTRRRLFTTAEQRFLRLRDQHCRTPWCEAPIRHADHIQPASRGGPTSVINGQGHCAACNYTKEQPGWHTKVISDSAGRHQTQLTTPTGHHYRSRAPDPPQTGADPLEQQFRELLRRAAA